MAYVRQRPDGKGNGIAEARADPVDDRAKTQIADGVGALKPEDDVRVGRLGPTQLGLQCRLQHPDRLSIDVVDGGRREQQPANDPTVAAYPRGRVVSGHSSPARIQRPGSKSNFWPRT